ncbi:MAG: chemotaxis protein CheA [Lachnospiraceae bacterium]|nr:chemotaxis protein CheA [Lachnospiraceae bacterium]
MAEEYITEGMLDMFIFESEQLLEEIENLALNHKDDECFDDAAINEIFRAMHTIKGSSGIMMYTNITMVSHALEDVFYYIRESDNKKVPQNELVDHMLKVSDFIHEELDKIKNGEDADGDPEELITEVEIFLDGIKKNITETGNDLPPEKEYVPPKQYYIAPVASEDSKFYTIHITYDKSTEMCNIRAYNAVYSLKEVAEDLQYFPDDIITNEKSSDVILENGFKMGLQTKSEVDEIMELIGRGIGVENIEINQCSADQFLNFCTEVREEEQIVLNTTPALEPMPPKEEEPVLVTAGDIAKQVKKNAETKVIGKGKPSKKQETQSFISVNIKKMDELMELMGEIVIAEAVVLQNPDLAVPGLDLTNFHKAAAQLSKITTELQESIMTMRMMPLKNTFQKMNRIVYDVSRKLGKEIELEIIGEETEVDKNIIEHISDPLMHLIRNSVDHGIETPQDRKKNGKDPKGKIILEAKNEGGKVWIIVRDDGKGMSREAILEKARDNGLLEKPEKEYSDKEVFAFVTKPGFSTKKEVTEYSGRGVGMDVVVKNIQDIGGSLDIESEWGKGSTMILKIPLTLAIIDGITFSVGKTNFVIATNSVKEFIQVEKEQMIVEPEGDEYVMIRGECFPVIRLNEFYDIKGAKENAEDGIMVIIEHEGETVCALADQLIGEQEIVVKPIPNYIKKVRGISGCTQLGDGSISLIIDPGTLVG